MWTNLTCRCSVAGSHTTSGTLTLLFAHLLQNPEILNRVVEELDAVLNELEGSIVPVNGLEAKLPYTMACVNENFRINPVFTMPLPREVMMCDGADIAGHVVPQGVCAPQTCPTLSRTARMKFGQNFS